MCLTHMTEIKIIVSLAIGYFCCKTVVKGCRREPEISESEDEEVQDSAEKMEEEPRLEEDDQALPPQMDQELPQEPASEKKTEEIRIERDLEYESVDLSKERLQRPEDPEKEKRFQNTESSTKQLP